jgi:hypothetical protein
LEKTDMTDNTPKVTRMTKAQLAEELVSAALGPSCGMSACEEKSTHLLIVEAHGDNTTIAIRCCEDHFKFLQAELVKRPDYLYLHHTTGDKFFGGETQ